MRIIVGISDLDSVLERYDQIKVYRADSYDGTYAEIGAANRTRLRAGVARYLIYDDTGTTSSWYKTSFYHSTTTAESDLSDPAPAEDVGITSNLLSVDQLKAVYLFGLDLTNDEGEPYPDLLFEWSIKFAIDWLEKELDIKLLPTKVVERHDYYRRDYQEWVYTRLHNWPIIDDLTGATLPDTNLTRVKAIWPAQTEIFEFDQRWLRLHEESGQLQIVPGQGSITQMLITAGGSYLPLISAGRDMIPGLFEVSYTAGFPAGEVPYALREVLGKKASFGPLNIAGDLLGGAGIASQSIGIDGLSQSFNTTSSATNCLGAAAPVGLLSGDQPIKDVVHRVQDGARPLVWCMDSRTRRHKLTCVTGAVESGSKDIYEVEVAGARPVRMSPEHLCLTDRGWLRLRQAVDLAALKPKSRFQTATGLGAVQKIKRIGSQDTYDIQVMGPHHNFICDGLVVHNSGYGSRILQYSKELKEQLETLRRYYKGIKMVAV